MIYARRALLALAAVAGVALMAFCTLLLAFWIASS